MSPTANAQPKLARQLAGQPANAGRLGVVTGGSLSEGLTVRLDESVKIERMAVGCYLLAHGDELRFFCMVKDVLLDSLSAAAIKQPPPADAALARTLRQGISAFGALQLAPLLALDPVSGTDEVRPVKTVPGHYAPVYAANQAEVDRIFGKEGIQQVDGRAAHFFHIGAPLEMPEVRITLHLERWVERSSAVFGKSGTGKTFLTRMLLAGVIQAGVAVNLIFDMHNEYGWAGMAEGDSRQVKGLKQLFPDRVAIFTLDPESSRRRGARADQAVVIGYEQIEPEDLEVLSGILRLNEAQLGAVYALNRRLGRQWLGSFLDDAWVERFVNGDEPGRGEKLSGLDGLAKALGQHPATLAALRRRFERMRSYTFLRQQAAEDAVGRLLRALAAGTHVVLEFGRYGADLGAYLFVANYLTRRLHRQYVEQTERALGDAGQEPRPLVITIEEAHKFLDPSISNETIFGTIAREMRKYNVTLLIVDQRPSGIDPEVLSQIGTKVTLLLDDPEDLKAALSGVGGAASLREVLSRLDSRGQALIVGHAVPMPVVVQLRRYDADFFRAIEEAK